MKLPSMAAMIRESRARERREARTPLVVYDRGGDRQSYGTCRLAALPDYLATLGASHKPERARIIEPDDLAALAIADAAMAKAHRAKQRVLARAFAAGREITKVEFGWHAGRERNET